MSKLVDSPHPLTAQTLREHFNRVATQTNQASPIQALMGERLLDRTDGLKLAPERILDVGTGFGAMRWPCTKRFPRHAL